MIDLLLVYGTDGADVDTKQEKKPLIDIKDLHINYFDVDLDNKNLSMDI